MTAVRAARVTPGRAPLAHVPVGRDVRGPWLWATGRSNPCTRPWPDRPAPAGRDRRNPSAGPRRGPRVVPPERDPAGVAAPVPPTPVALARSRPGRHPRGMGDSPDPAEQFRAFRRPPPEADRRAAANLARVLRADPPGQWTDDTSMALCLASSLVEKSGFDAEDQMRRYLSCDKRGPDGQYIGWTGRSDDYGFHESPDRWHPVIHGRLFDKGAIELRKSVAQANEALLRDERIRDLEDQVKSLVAQVAKAEAEKGRMWERLRDARVDA